MNNAATFEQRIIESPKIESAGVEAGAKMFVDSLECLYFAPV